MIFAFFCLIFAALITNFMKLSLLSSLSALLLAVSCTQQYSQPELGTRSVDILTEGKYQFKDMNKNGVLDPYEDWRLSPEQRADDLVSQMTLEEKAGFMIISQINMGGNGREVTSDLYEEDQVTTRNMFTGLESEPAINVSATTKGILERNLRHFILRANAPARVMAEWSNKVQEVAESSRLGIPCIYASNPRNHIATDNSAGLNVGGTSFTQWPSTLGLAAMDDIALVRKFAEATASEWVACGIRKGYMYQLDLATEPRWSRIEGTFGEDADKVAEIATELVLGFQGKTLSSNSVALTMKHFPGAGTEYKGWDAHFDYGKNLVYPAEMLEYHLKPFKAAVEAGTSAIMPYYAQPKGTSYEEVGFTFNKGIIGDLLRETIGFNGIINSDTGPINNMPWGVEDLDKVQRYAKAIEAGTDLFSGSVDTENLLAAVNAGLVSEDRIDVSVKRLLIEKFSLGLFENPYVDPDKAESLVNCKEYQDLAAEAFRKSIVLLKNDASVLPLKDGAKVFVESMSAPGRDGGNGRKVVEPEGEYGVEFCSSLDDADVAVLWVTPTGGSMFSVGAQGAQYTDNRLSKNGVDVDYINSVAAKKPTVVLLNFSKPWVTQEIEGNTSTLLATFGTTLPAMMDVLTGKFTPTGKLPFAIPSSQEAVDNNKEDLPGNMEPEGYALYKCGFGLGY